MSAHAITDANWSEAFPLNGVTCFMARDGDEWLIATAASPRFCFSGPSQIDVIDKAYRAIEFWRYSKVKDGPLA